MLGHDLSYHNQERFGIFFIGEHESFGGSEEHFERVRFDSPYIPPNSYEYSDREQSVSIIPELLLILSIS